MTSLPPHFKDRTKDLIHWNEAIDSFMLPRLATACNNYLQPTIKCPWGCSEFLHKVGNISLDIIFQRYLPRCLLPIFTATAKQLEKRVISAREDYILEKDEGEDSWIFNPLWRVVPTIIYIEGKGPCVCTCKEHSGGNKYHMIHSCRWKHNLTAKRSDQLTQAVIQPRILRPLKASKYSISFQMFHQTGTFNDIDTCSHTSFGNFNINSHQHYDQDYLRSMLMRKAGK